MLNMETLSKPELLTLFSILEGELEARDLVIDALKVNTATLDVFMYSPYIYYHSRPIQGNKVIETSDQIRP